MNVNVRVKDCPNCDGSDLRIAIGDAMGPEGRALLPGVSGFFQLARFAVVVCCSCGLARFFVTQEETEKVRAKWEPLQGTEDA